MIYNGTEKMELIYFHLENDESVRHFVTMEIDSDEPVFYVRTCCNDDWEWKFYYTASNYEMVRHAIFDAGLESENMAEMLWTLDAIFEEIFEDIIVWDCDCDCDGNCENCKCE